MSLTRGTAAHREDRRLLAEAEMAQGKSAFMLGHPGEEREAYLRAIAIRRSLSQEQPDDLDDRFALATALYRLHDIPPIEESATILRELLSRDPRRADYRWELSSALAFLGSSYYDRGDVIRSEGYHREALRLREELVHEFPEEFRYRQRLQGSLVDSGRDLQTLGRLPEAETLFQQSLKLAQRLAADFPSFPTNRTNVAVSLVNVGEVLRDQGRLAEAEPYFLQGIAIIEQEIAQHPDIPWFQGTLLATCRLGLGPLLEKTGREREALRTYREALRAFEQFAPGSINVLENQENRSEASARIAHLLATSHDPTLRDPAAAVAMARKAADLNPRRTETWNTLGIACYRAGDWAAAIETLEKSIELRSKGDTSTWLILARACWQKGDKAKAREWYTTATTWMEKNPAKSGEFAHLRDEAATLMGLTGPSRPVEGKTENPPRRSSP